MPQALEIDRFLAKRESYRRIAKRFGVTEAGITRHVRNCIPEFLEASRAEQKRERAIVVEDEINRVFGRLNKLLDACDEWLSDPDNRASSNYSRGCRGSSSAIARTSRVERMSGNSGK